METLTKENFWNEMEQKYPKAMAHFKAWIDKYKSEHNWDGLFLKQLRADNDFIPDSVALGRYTHESTKYHELPIAMQFGIFLEWYVTTIKSLFPGSKSVQVDNPRFHIKVILAEIEPWFERNLLP